MANIRVNLDIKNIPALERDILDTLARHINLAIQKSLEGIRRRIGEAVSKAIEGAPEYTSLLTGKLRGELGVVEAAPVLRAVITNIVDGIKVTSLGAKREGKQIKGGIRIEILKGDYSEVLSVAGGSFTSEGGYDIDWLRWLTLEGDRIIVADHRFLGGFRKGSRTGQGIMIESRKLPWRVPPEFAGTDADNWLTRALEKIDPDVEKILAEELQRNV